MAICLFPDEMRIKLTRGPSSPTVDDVINHELRRMVNPVQVMGINERRVDVGMPGKRLRLLETRAAEQGHRHGAVPQAVRRNAV